MKTLEDLTGFEAENFHILHAHEEQCQTPGRPWLIGREAVHRDAVVLQPRCGLWSCPACSLRNARRWIARGIHGAKELQVRDYNLFFLTLTHRGGLSPHETRRRWRVGWNKLSQRARRAALRKPEYLYVHEHHKDGRLHTHMITTCELGARWWKDNPAKCGFGYMNDYQDCRSAPGAGAYVGKYLGKQMAGGAWPAGWRRVGTSRGWPPLPPVGPNSLYQWTVVKTVIDLHTEVDDLYLDGYDVRVVEGTDLEKDIDSWLI